MANLPQSQELLTVEQVAEEMKVTSQTIRNWIKSGLLPAILVKHLYRIRREDLDALLSPERGRSGPLVTDRDPWAPETLGSPVRRQDSERAPSIWDGASDRIVPTKRR
ncbi:MAG: helix-turn-helix domain-containing protein [Solirubrobacteraceae bacterium]|jgi:excisionase family DNA binding protein